MEHSKEVLHAKGWELLCALDDHDLPERVRLVVGWIVRLSYLEGFPKVRIPRQEDLSVLTGIDKTKIGAVLYEAKEEYMILQTYPEENLYEILPDAANWHAKPRCRFGVAGAAALASRIAADYRRHCSEQRDLGEIEQSFQPEPTLRHIIGENSREAAFGPVEDRADSAEDSYQHPPGPGEIGGCSNQRPPGIIGQSVDVSAGGALASAVRQHIYGPARRSELPKRQLSSSADQYESGKGVAYKATPPRPEGQQPGDKVALKATFAAVQHVDPGEKLPNRQLPRRRASDDQSSGHSGHLVIPSQQLSSADDQKADDGRRNERGGAGSAEGQMVRMDDEVFGDIRRVLGDQMGSFTANWRRAISLSRSAAVHALEAVKLNRPERNPGGYMAVSFLNECRRLGVRVPPELFGRGKQRKGVAA